MLSEQRFPLGQLIPITSEAVPIPGEEIPDRHQVGEGVLSWDVGDVGRPDLIQCSDLLAINHAGKSLGWFAGDRGALLLVDRP
jgi:hypothetical protein